MEPITHLMTGACLARAGFNRKAAYATLAMTLAAEAPDVDTFWSLDGPVAGFQHHRGITHTFLGLPFEAAFIVGGVWLLHRWRTRRAKPTPVPQDPTADHPIPHPLTAAPVRWTLLYCFSLIALLSHLFLDWTNNYGIRPFFPFNPRWYAGSFVFIFEPLLFAALVIGLTAPALFGLINSEIGARRPAFRGRGWATFALLCMLGIWTWRFTEHDAALRLASTASYGPASDNAQVEVLRVTASPYPINPYRWHTVVETPDLFQLGTTDTRMGTVDTDPAEDIVYKPPTTLFTLVAKRSWLGEVYLDWSSWPVVTDIGHVGSFGSNPEVAAPPGTTAVTFRDLRFMYDTAFLKGRRDPPLSGTVYLNPDRRVIQTEMNGKVQH